MFHMLSFHHDVGCFVAVLLCELSLVSVFAVRYHVVDLIRQLCCYGYASCLLGFPDNSVFVALSGTSVFTHEPRGGCLGPYTCNFLFLS